MIKYYQTSFYELFLIRIVYALHFIRLYKKTHAHLHTYTHKHTRLLKHTDTYTRISFNTFINIRTLRGNALDWNSSTYVKCVRLVSFHSIRLDHTARFLFSLTLIGWSPIIPHGGQSQRPRSIQRMRIKKHRTPKRYNQSKHIDFEAQRYVKICSIEYITQSFRKANKTIFFRQAKIFCSSSRCTFKLCCWWWFLARCLIGADLAVKYSNERARH